MCNINIFLRRNGKFSKGPDLFKFVSLMAFSTQASYESNSHGDGVYFKGQIAKSENKIDIFSMAEQFQEDGVVITHQRLATHGKEAIYVQPFMNEEFVFVHNGVLYEHIPEVGSDSFGFFNQFLQVLTEVSGTREEKITKAIKKLTSEVRSGWYSIAIYDKIEDSLYYFKDEATKIHCWRNKDMLYLTTKSENGDLIGVLGDFKEIKIKPMRLYKFIIGQDGIYKKAIGNLPKKKPSLVQNTTYTNYTRDDWYQNNRGTIDTAMPEDADIIEMVDAMRCAICSQLTHVKVKSTGEPICETCFEEDEEIRNWNESFMRYYD